MLLEPIEIAWHWYAFRMMSSNGITYWVNYEDIIILKDTLFYYYEHLNHSHLEKWMLEYQKKFGSILNLFYPNL